MIIFFVPLSMKELSIQNIFSFFKILQKPKIKIEINLIGYDILIIININNVILYNQKIIDLLLIQSKYDIYWFNDFEELYKWGEFIINDSQTTHIVFIG